jgi:hypothetical protein
MFVVWVRGELAVLELTGFSETVGKRVFCIVRQTAIVTACRPFEPHCKRPCGLSSIQARRSMWRRWRSSMSSSNTAQRSNAAVAADASLWRILATELKEYAHAA